MHTIRNRKKPKLSVQKVAFLRSDKNQSIRYADHKAYAHVSWAKIGVVFLVNQNPVEKIQSTTTRASLTRRSRMLKF